MGDLEEEEDYEAFELRQKAAQAVADHDAEDFDKKHGGGSRGDEYSDDDDLQRADELDRNGEERDGQYNEEDGYYHSRTDDENYQ